MNPTKRIFIVNNIKLPVNASAKEAFSVAKGRLRSVGVNNAEDFRIYRRSTDARRRDAIRFVYSVAASSFVFVDENKLKCADISVLEPRDIDEISYGAESLSAPPVVVGSGPCGLFCALLLAEHGYKPILIERGGDVKERNEAVNRFKRLRILDTEMNIQFGAGGAGTFSDGKLVTRINDPLCHTVLSRFVEFGAPEEILYIARPHVGTDILSGIVDGMLKRIEQLGGRVLYHTRLDKIKFAGRDAIGVATSRGDISAGAVVLALGHSARDTYAALSAMGFALEAKSFSVGMRIEHLTDDIDKAMYGDMAGMPELGHAEYNLSHNTKERGVYTFCMCPGGEVVPAASEEGGVVVNGMSEYLRDGRNSNSAVCSTVFKEDFGGTPEGAIEFQRRIERRAFAAAGKDYSAPIITVGDFLSGELKSEPGRVIPTYSDSMSVRLVRPEEYLPGVVCDGIKSALLSFDKKISGFAARDAVLSGAETRTSAPIRILRDSESRLALGFGNVYPAGEGAGYAGGITSAAVDGLKTAISIMNKYKP